MIKQGRKSTRSSKTIPHQNTKPSRSDKTHISKKTETIRNDASYKAALGHLRTIINTVPVAMLLIDSNQRIQLANESFCSMFRFELSQVEGKSLTEMEDEHWKIPALTKMLETVFVQGAPFRGLEISQNFPRVGHRDLTLHATASRLGGTGSIAAVLAIEDHTPRKHMIEQRSPERSHLIRDEFLAMLSHELRTPLTTILGWAQTLRLGKSDPEKTERAIAVIEKSARDQGQLIDDLLDVSRIQSGKMLLKLREIDPKACVASALESVRSLAASKSIEIQSHFDSAICAIHADPGRIEQVFRNLFTNAIKFTPQGGKITVRTKLRKDKKHIEIQVEDTGKGIRAEFLPHLFARFSQEDSSSKRMFGGLGLGLSLVRNLVQMHQGSVTAYSAGEGNGAVFTVILPCIVRSSHSSRSLQSLETADLTVSRPTSLAGLRVLVIDDLEDARDAFSEILQSSHAQVETAASAAAGLEALSRFRPDLILCDIAMPEEDGLSFIRKVRSLEPEKGGKTPSIAVTAYANTTDVHKALAAGFDAHLAKPVDAVELSRLIAKLARRGNSRR